MTARLTLGLLIFAISLSPALASDTGPEASKPELEIDDLQNVAIITFTTTDGVTDEFWTSLFIEQLQKRRPDYKIIDPLEVSVKFGNEATFNSQATLSALLEAARQTGADAIFIGNGSKYSVGWRLEVKLITVENGRVLWSKADSSGMTMTGPRAKTKAVKKIVKDFPPRPKG